MQWASNVVHFRAWPAALGIAILAGLTEAEEVVTGGSFTMKTEFLKSRLGAGCVDD